MNKELLNLTVHVFTEHLPNFPRWCVCFSMAPHGYFRARADCPVEAFAAAWDDFTRTHIASVPAWLKTMIRKPDQVTTRSKRQHGRFGV